MNRIRREDCIHTAIERIGGPVPKRLSFNWSRQTGRGCESSFLNFWTRVPDSGNENESYEMLKWSGLRCTEFDPKRLEFVSVDRRCVWPIAPSAGAVSGRNQKCCRTTAVLCYLPVLAARLLLSDSRILCPRASSRNGFCRSSCFGSRTCWLDNRLLEYPDMKMTLVSG